MQTLMIDDTEAPVPLWRIAGESESYLPRAFPEVHSVGEVIRRCELGSEQAEGSGTFKQLSPANQTVESQFPAGGNRNTNRRCEEAELRSDGAQRFLGVGAGEKPGSGA